MSMKAFILNQYLIESVIQHLNYREYIQYK